MKGFVEDPDFLLDTGAASKLYHGWAEGQPIVDYHCHIDPKEIWEDRRYEDLSQVWLGGDHYKWRLMRSNGVEEKYITGDASDYEKFEKFAQTLPRAIGNPMYHWCHLELKNYFGYTGVLNGETAQAVWDLCSDKLKNDPGMSARGLIRQSNVAMVGTTDDPCSDLIWHEKLSGDESFSPQVLPSFRPDPAVNLHKAGFAGYVAKLEETVGHGITTIEEMRRALSERIAFFAAHGCRAADHGLDYVMCREVSDEAATAVMNRARAGEVLTREEAEGYQTALLLHCAREYRRLGWVMQLHFSCMRNPNSRMMTALGPDSGFDCIAVTDSCAALYRLLDTLERGGEPAQDGAVQPEPGGQRLDRHPAGGLPGPRGAGEDPARQRLVVQRPQGGHDRAPDQPGQFEHPGQLHRHAHRQPEPFELRPARVLPPGALRPAGPVGGERGVPQ